MNRSILSMNLFNKRKFVLFVSTISGFSVMILEVCSVRLLGPYFGTSTVVWTNVLSVVLVALSAGSLYGDKLFEKNPNNNIAPMLFVYSGLSILLIPLLSNQVSALIFNLLVKNPVNLIFTGSLISSILIFGVQFFILGTISPYLISYLNKNHLGDNNTGWIIALSTIGGVLGTILPTMILIPIVGTKFCILFIGILLFVVGSIGYFNNRYIPLLIIAVLFTKPNLEIFSEPLVQKESRDQYIKITEVEGVRYLKFESGFGIQSVYNPNSVLTSMYYDYINVLPELIHKKTPIKVLILGLSGGTTARALNKFYGNKVEITGIESDPEVINLAKEYMGLPKEVRTISQDARMFLRTTDEKYDVIYLDAFANEFQLPWHLSTLEFWKLASEHLEEGGVVGMNVFSLKQNGGDLLNSISATGKKVFSHVYHIPITESEDRNILLLMSNKRINPEDFVSLNPDPDLKKIRQQTIKNIREFTESDNYRILTDDSTPLELLYISDLVK